MGALYRRDWSLVVGTMRIAPSSHGRPLDIEFSVEKSKEREPNTAEIRIFNLGREMRESITSPSEVQLRAGHVETGADVIFSGQARKVERGSKKRKGISSDRSEADIITLLECDDSGDSYRGTEFNRSYAANTPIATVLRELCDVMGLGRGNLDAHVANMRLGNGRDRYLDGVTFAGPGRRTFDRLIRAAGYRWTIANGVLQVSLLGQPAQTTAVRLSPGTGLVGSPTVDADGKVLCTALLIPGLYPNRVVMLESSEVNGAYQVERCSYKGSTFANDWNVGLTMREY